MKIRLILPLLLLMVIGCTNTPEYEYTLPQVTIEAPRANVVYFTKDNLQYYSNAAILSGVVEHECTTCNEQERHLVMETTWNRVINNYGKHGYNIISQLLAPKQFTGLFTDNPKKFYFDPSNERHLRNFQMAKEIIDGKRISNKCTYYWASKQIDKDTLHWRQLYPKRIKVKFKTKQIYG